MLFEREMPQNSSQDVLKTINTKKSDGPDELDAHLLQIAAEIIAEPLTHILTWQS